MTTPVLQFANGAASTLANGIVPSATSLTVVAGQGTLFPQPVPGQSQFLATLIDAATGGIKEIILVTNRVTDTMTIVRAQEGTTALSWNAGDQFKQLITAGTATTWAQLVQVQSGTYNFAVDTGTANNYVAAISPPITTRINGLTVRIKATNPNSGASTLDIGAGPISVSNPDGSALGAGAIVTGGIFEVVDLGSGPYQLISNSQQAQSLSGAATTGDFKFRPTSETIAGWVIANATTIGNASSNATQRANTDTSLLFQWHWNNFSNTQCPIFTSAGAPTTRGANAAADFAANKAIQVYDKRGKGEIGVDTMQGGTTTRLSGVPITSGNATTPGSVLGENLHTLIAAEVPNLSVSGQSVPGLSVPSLNVPGLSVPGLSVPALSVPGLSVPGLSVPGLSIPSLSVSTATANVGRIPLSTGTISSLQTQASATINITPANTSGNWTEITSLSASGSTGVNTTGGGTTGGGTTGGGATGGGTTGGGTTGGSVTGTGTTGTGTTGGGATTTGGGGSHNNVMLVDGMTYYIKL